MVFVGYKLSQNRKILSILMIIFLLVVVVANSKSSHYGSKVHLLCSYGKPISGCQFIIPGETLEIHLFENQTVSHQKYEYFGTGFDRGDCGITINNVTKENEGYARCLLRDYNNSEQFETVQIKIFDLNNRHVGMPKLKISNSGPLKVSQILEAECAVKRNDEYFNISWLLNDKTLNTFTNKQSRNDNGRTFELKSILKHTIESIDNGSTLKCRTRLSNYSQEFIDTTLELVVVNETVLMPKIGLPFDIFIKFSAYPRVVSIKWRVNQNFVYYVTTSNEFTSRELKYLGKNQWEAVLNIANVTETNFYYNYTLEVIDLNGTTFYDYRLDNFLAVDDSEQSQAEEQTTIVLPTFNVGENTITSSPKLHPTKQQVLYRKQQQKGEKSNMFRRTTATTTKSSRNTTIHPLTTDRRSKYTRKQQKSKNTSILITEMTSVISTTTEPTTVVVMTKENTNDTTEETVSDENLSNIDEMNELTTTTNENLTEIIAIDDANNVTRVNENIERFFIKISFATMILIIIIFLFILCHYRHQVTKLKSEIIQMNLENYYNQSCLYPSTFNEYSSTNFQQNDGGAFYIKRPLDNSNNNYNHEDSDMISISSNQLLSTYSTNSHLYQSIDAYDIENHVYDEIVQTKENGDEKLNNYENNESFNNTHEILVPTHCRTLMTIPEEEEFESSQIQILSSLESTYI